MEITQYFKRVLRWWWLFLLSTAIAGAISYYASSQLPRVYQTTATLLVGQVIQKTNPTGQDFYTIEQLAESYAQIAVRQPILQAAIDSLGLKMGWQFLRSRVNVTPVPRTQLLAVTVQDTSPERAVAIADEIARQLILQSPTSPQNQERVDRSAFVQQQLLSLEGRISRAEERLQELETELDSALSARQIQDIETEKTGLEALINEWQANYVSLLSFLEGGDSPNYLTVIEPAQLPTYPVSPDIKMNVLLAAAAGFALALGAVLLLEYIDDTLKTPDDLMRVTGITALGSVMRIKGKSYKEKMALAHEPFSPIGEAYRLIRTNIQFMAVDTPAQLIMGTSASPGEGKSTTIANLGVVMAQADLRTIIVDTDLRQPTQHKIFRVPNSGGVTDLLLSPDAAIEEQLVNTGYDNLKLITSGPLPPNSSELLGSQRMGQLLEQLRFKADVILFDTPPVLAVTDASVLSNRMDGVVLIVHAKRTRRADVTEAVERLEKVGAKVLGGVLNQISMGDSSHYYYSYYSRRQPGASRRQATGAMVRRWWQRLPLLKLHK